MEEKIIKEEIIEKIGENNKKIIFKTSELINTIITNFNKTGKHIELDYKDFGQKYSIPEIICKNTKVTNLLIHKAIYYKNVRLLLNPKTIHFLSLDGKETTYLIYNKSFVEKIKDSLQFKNPIIIMNRKEFPYKHLENIFYRLETEFNIEEKEEEDYQFLFKKYQRTDSNLGIQIKKEEDLLNNFKYYFKYPKPDEEFEFIFSKKRSDIFQDKYINKDKILGYCGPIGISISTTLLGLAKIEPNYCYFNIKVLKEAEEHV